MPIRLDLVRGFTPTAVTNALLRPSAFGWPDRTNTGPLPDLTLEPSGPLVITTPGAVVSGLAIDAIAAGIGIEVRAPGVTLENLDIITTPQPGGGCIKQTNNATGLIVRQSRLRYDQPGSYDAVIGEADYTMEWCEVVDVAEGPRFGNNCTIRHNWIRRMRVNDAEAHADGGQTVGALNFVFEANTVDVSDSTGASKPSAALIVGTEGGPTSGIIRGNLFNGAAYTLRAGPSSHPMTLEISGNRFGRVFDFGPHSITGGDIHLTWFDNRWDDDNSEVPAPVLG